MYGRVALVAATAAAVVSASPIEARQEFVASVPLTYVSTISNGTSLVAKGLNRLEKLNGKSLFARANSGSITNEDVTYVAPISVGGNTWQLIVDTGSSNLWCGAQSACERTSTGKDTGNTFQVSYGSGSVSGEEYTDTVSFAGLTVKSQSLGAANSAQGFDGVDGIIGFGPQDLTQGTVSNTNQVPTFMDNLYSSGAIKTEVLGVYFHPESGGDTDDTNGELTLGGIDSTKYSGTLTYFPQLTSGAASPYWGISIASFTYGSTTLSSNNQGIVDTGTTLIYLPSTAYSKFLTATGGTTDSNSGLPSFKTKPTSNFNIKFGSTTYSLTPAQYLVPTSQYSEFGCASGKYYAFFANGGSSGVNVIIGQKFLENYYSVFDTTNARIGFATRT